MKKQAVENWFTRLEFSKKLLLLESAASMILVVTVAVISIRGGDISILSALTGGSVLMNGTVSAFYLWKSKCENRAKYAQAFIAKFAEQYGFDNALRITEFVIRD